MSTVSRLSTGALMNINFLKNAAWVVFLLLFHHGQVIAADVTGLRADIYSTTTAELFWDRVPNQALTYEVVRDDGQTHVTEGTSYYDTNRSDGITNEYTVVSIDDDGVRSNPTSVTVGPFSQSSLQVLHLRADVYSNTAAELFWIRVPERDLTYEIMRDDGMIATTKGDSHYDDTRTPGTINDYTVTTIDEQGVRSLPVTIKVAAFGVESINSPPATGLRASVYSSTAAEIIWDRVPNRALRYEILRDDGLSNITNGTSYYDNRRLPGRANTYIITTIDEEGNRSSQVSIDVEAG